MTWLPDPVLRHLREVCEAPDLSGTRYRLLGELGRGGEGTVYLAEDQALGREVALKVLDNPLEARKLASIEHPGVVPVHDSGVLPDGRLFYTMKRVAGVRLCEFATAGHNLGERLLVFVHICDTIAFAHQRGLLHCDLKAENIMVGQFGEALVMDWGLARPAGAGEPAGTPGVTAPEQERGEFSPAGDVYALGGILQSLLPADAPKRLRAIAAMAHAEDPAERYASVRELRADLDRYLGGVPVRAYREGIGERALALLTRHGALVLLLVAYLLARAAVLLFRNR